MLTEDISDPNATDPATLRREYGAFLAERVEGVGVSTAAAETGVPADRLETIGDGAALTVEEAAAVAALGDDSLDAEGVALELRDHLLLAMSSAVMDVDAVAAEFDDLDPRDVQQKLEGRQSMTLTEYARVHHLLAVEGQW